MSLGLGLGLNIRPVSNAHNEVFQFGFLNGVLPAGATLTRASDNGTYFDSALVLQTAAANVARFTYNPSTGALRGLLVEPARTNGIRNNTGQGVVAGSPGTLPTNWTASGGAGLTRTVVGTGVEDGIEYVDIRWAGTPSSTLFINLEGSTQIAALTGQTWTNSIYPKLAAGSVTGVTFSVNIAENNSGGTALAVTGQSFVPTTAALRTQRVSVSRTFNQATTAYTLPYMPLSFTGVAVDFTLRFGLPQSEQGSSRSSVIEDSGSAGTRAEDVLTLTVTPGVYNIAIVRESGATTVSGLYVNGSYVVPTDVSPVQSVTFTRQADPAFTYFVDSVAGSDANNGRSSSFPFQNLTALPTLTANQSVGLKYAASWTNQSIVSAADNITVAAYGTPGTLPLIDGNATSTYCIALTGSGATVRNVRCIEPTSNDGAIYVQYDGVIDGVTAESGVLHTLLLGSGTVSNSLIKDGSGASLLEFFTGEDGVSAVASDNNIGLAVYDAGMAGLDFHTSGGSVTYASITSERNTYTNLGNGFSGGDCDMRISTDDIFDGCLSCYGISGDAVITNPTDTNGVATGKFMNISAANATVVLDGGTVCREAFNTSVISCSQTGLNFTAKGPLKIGANSSSLFAIFFFDYGDITIGEAGVTQEYDTANIPYIGILGRGANNAVLRTPGNYIFSTATFSLEINGTTYASLSAMQAAGYFLNATVGTVTACA